VTETSTVESRRDSGDLRRLPRTGHYTASQAMRLCAIYHVQIVGLMTSLRLIAAHYEHWRRRIRTHISPLRPESHSGQGCKMSTSTYGVFTKVQSTYGDWAKSLGHSELNLIWKRIDMAQLNSMLPWSLCIHQRRGWS
jgi:hypothetical protein